MHLSTAEPAAASWILELFEAVGGDISECFQLEKVVSIYEIVKSYCEKLVLKT